MNTMMIDMSAVAPRVPQGKGTVGARGQAFADFLEKQPSDLRSDSQEVDWTDLLAAFSAPPTNEGGAKHGDMAFLIPFLNNAAQTEAELRSVLESLQQAGVPMPMGIARQAQDTIALPGDEVLPSAEGVRTVAEVLSGVAEQSTVTVSAEEKGDMLIPAMRSAAAGLPTAAVLAVEGEAVPVSLDLNEDVASGQLKIALPAEVSLASGVAEAPALAAIVPKAESGQRRSSGAAEAPALLDSMLSKMLGTDVSLRQQQVDSRHETADLGLMKGLSPESSMKGGVDVQIAPAEIEVAGNTRSASAAFLLDAQNSAGLSLKAPVAEATSEAGLQGGQLHAARQAVMPDPEAVPGSGLRLSSGLMVPDEQIVDQVLGRMTVGRGREASSMTMRLHPEELGEVKLSLLVEKETVKAQLVVQSQQVQEVLDRHMPRLREALAQQGLKLEDVQVSVDSRQGEGKGFFQDQHQPSTPFRFAVHRGGVVTAANEISAPAGQQLVKSGLSIRI